MGLTFTMGTRLSAALLFVSIASVGLIHWASLTTGHVWGDDFASYMMQARAIVEGSTREFVDANRFTIDHSPIGYAPVAYPWGFSLLLAPLYAAFNLDPFALKFVGFACFLGFVAVLWVGMKRHHAIGWRLALIGLVGLNPMLGSFLDELVSDIPFLLVSTAGILLIGRVVVERRPIAGTFYDSVMIGAVIAVAWAIRTNGVLLIGALGAAHIVTLSSAIWSRRRSRVDGSWFESGLQEIRREWRGLVVPYGVFVVLAGALQVMLPAAGESYTPLLSRVSSWSIRQNLHYYFDLPAEFFTGIPHERVIYGAALPLVLMGVVARARRDYHVIVYIALTFCLYVVWPALQGPRFILPILPFCVSFLLTGLERVTSRAELGTTGRRSILPLVFLAVCCFAYVSVDRAIGNLIRGRHTSIGPYTDEAQRLWSFIRSDVPSGSTVVFFKPRALSMFTGRQAAKITEVDQLVAGDYLGLFRIGQRQFYESHQIGASDVACLVDAGIAELTYSSDDFTLYRLRGGIVAPGCQLASGSR